MQMTSLVKFGTSRRFELRNGYVYGTQIDYALTIMVCANS